MNNQVLNAVDRNAPKPDRVVIDGNEIHVDRETSRALLAQLAVSANDDGAYIATIRDRPLEAVGPVIAPIARPDAEDRAWRAVADPNEVRDVCDICGHPEVDRALAIDHNHATGALRGYLCGSCNRALGLFKDSAELLRRAAAYLDAPPGIPVLKYLPGSTGKRRVG